MRSSTDMNADAKIDRRSRGRWQPTHVEAPRRRRGDRDPRVRSPIGEAASDSIAMHADFADRCASLMGVLRDQGHLALLLQTLKELVPAGLPEITEESITWMPEVLLKPESQLRAELASALSDWVRRLDNMNHNRIHQTPTPSSAKKSADAERRSSTLLETEIEVEELRKLLSREEARADGLQRELDALRAASS